MSSSRLLGMESLTEMSYVPFFPFSFTLNDLMDALNVFITSITSFITDGSRAALTLSVVWKLDVLGVSLHLTYWIR